MCDDPKAAQKTQKRLEAILKVLKETSRYMGYLSRSKITVKRDCVAY